MAWMFARSSIRLAIGAAAVVGLIGCAPFGPAQPAITSAPAATTATPLPIATPIATPEPADSVLDPVLESAARGDLAQRLGIAATAITVRTVESVDWPDASLGCPQPGMMYAQVITPGYRIVLEAGGERYEYHGSTNNVVFCSMPGEAEGR